MEESHLLAEFMGSVFAYNTVKESHCSVMNASHFAALLFAFLLVQ